MEQRPDDISFISKLFTKLSFTKQIEAKTGKTTAAAQDEVLRQIRQASHGNPITGEGVTKSGQED
jgi:hypothetical protein